MAAREQAAGGENGSEASRALLLARAASGLAHEGKNPLHTMALHLHLLTDKLARVAPADAAVERHAKALREGIGRVDALLRAFADLAAPAQVRPDLAGALQRALLLFGYEARRAGGSFAEPPPPEEPLLVAAPGEALNDLVAHALLAVLPVARGGGTLAARLRSTDARADLSLDADGGQGALDGQHVAAVRGLALELSADLSLAAPAPGSARLSLSFPRAKHSEAP